jgi:hypothetical protein
VARYPICSMHMFINKCGLYWIGHASSDLASLGPTKKCGYDAAFKPCPDTMEEARSRAVPMY